jgi:hypothetical protein
MRYTCTRHLQFSFPFLVEVLVSEYFPAGAEREGQKGRQAECSEQVLPSARVDVLLHGGEDRPIEHRGASVDQGHSDCEF